MSAYDNWPTTLNPLAILRRLGRSNWSTPYRNGPDGWAYVELGGKGSVVVTVAPVGDDDAEWIHASVAWRDDMPTYSDLKWLHACVFEDRWAYQLFTPPADHVNIHNYALHLFGRLDGKPALPDFTGGMGSI